MFGPSEALYGYETPSWISAGDFHSYRVPDDENPIVTGYSSNALIDMEFVRKRGLRFLSCAWTHRRRGHTVLLCSTSEWRCS